MYSLILAYLLAFGGPNTGDYTVVVKPRLDIPSTLSVYRPMADEDSTGDDSGGDEGHTHPNVIGGGFNPCRP